MEHDHKFAGKKRNRPDGPDQIIPYPKKSTSIINTEELENQLADSQLVTKQAIKKAYQETRNAKLQVSRRRLLTAMAELSKIQKEIEEKLKNGMSEAEEENLDKAIEIMMQPKHEDSWLAPFISFFTPKPRLEVSCLDEFMVPRLRLQPVEYSELVKSSK